MLFLESETFLELQEISPMSQGMNVSKAL